MTETRTDSQRDFPSHNQALWQGLSVVKCTWEFIVTSIHVKHYLSQLIILQAAADLWFNWNLTPHIAKFIHFFSPIALHSNDEHNTI